MAVAREIKDVPIVFSVVFDPVEAGLVKDWKSSGNNVTGTSTLVPMSTLMDNLKLLAPVKRLAVLYTPGEKNSESTLKRLQEVQAAYRITVLPVLITKKEDLSHILPEVIRTSDAIYLTGSNLVDSEVSTIVDMATRGNVITVTHLEDLAEKGVLLGVCSDSYTLGRLAGGKGIKILKGAKPSSIPTEVLKKFSVILNMKTAAAGQFKISSDVMKKITRKIE
jgi:putative ABC transport system substrate-binding protein